MNDDTRPRHWSEPAARRQTPAPRHALRRKGTLETSFERLLVSLGLIGQESIPHIIRACRDHGGPLARFVYAEGLVDEEDLFGAIAAFHDLPFLALPENGLKVRVKPSEISSCLADGWIELENEHGARIIAAAPGDSSITTLRHLGGEHGRTEPFDAITTPSAIRSWIVRRYGDHLLDDSILALAESMPDLSAHRRLSGGQALVAASLLLVLAAALFFTPAILGGVLFVSASIVFLGVAVHRLLAFFSEIGTPRRKHPPPRIADGQLPVYTVLVPLYREANMVSQIVTSVLALDYPRSKLDVKLILEADDGPTCAAADALGLPGCIEIIRVPTALPRTKPKALNYALRFARGAFVTVYDAEDIPEPQQLRRALDAFSRGGRGLACLQSRLSIADTPNGWLTRQFAVEYAALFNVLLPGFDNLGHPLMLGGTSNHFRVDILRRIGAWDPYNVTEDADIGIRLSRFGYRAGWLDSDTREEAPDTLRGWMAQRTRWLRGWMQTYLVHMRSPVRLWREIGTTRFAALQLLLAGVVLSALAHPIFIGQLAYGVAVGPLFVPRAEIWYDSMLVISGISLIIGYCVVLEISVLGLYRAGRPDLLSEVLLTPIYWMLISLAAFNALIRLAIAPHTWEKTHHRGGPPAS